MPNDSIISQTNQNLSYYEKGLIAFDKAIDGVILEHQRLSMPLHIIREGKVIAICAEEALKERAVEAK